MTPIIIPNLGEWGRGRLKFKATNQIISFMVEEGTWLCQKARPFKLGTSMN
jgi:hypothetical protein